MPGHEALLKHQINTRCMSRDLRTFVLRCGMSVTNPYDGIIKYLFQATAVGQDVVRILSEDSDLFVLLVYKT